jgi:hypothetical protein
MSKNNPAKRDNLKLVVYCPDTGEPMKIIKRVPGNKMFYKSEKTGKYYPVTRGCYKDFKHEWVKK